MFAKGKKKTGGRVKGQSAKIRKTVREICEAANVDVVGELLALRHELEPKDKAKVLQILLPYLYPSLRSSEVSGTVEHVVSRPQVQIILPSNGRELNAVQVSALASSNVTPDNALVTSTQAIVGQKGTN